MMRTSWFHPLGIFPCCGSIHTFTKSINSIFKIKATAIFFLNSKTKILKFTGQIPSNYVSGVNFAEEYRYDGHNTEKFSTRGDGVSVWCQQAN
jgi:hypothetical protein